MIVMGGVIGAGIFANPSIVARLVHSPTLILACWVIGGLIAFAGALIYAELAVRLPLVGGQYAYLREGLHPGVAFAYGWSLLLVIQSGGMAAVAIVFASYFKGLTHLLVPDWQIAVSTLGILATINCLGVRAGAKVQNVLMVTKIVTISGLILLGIFAGSGAEHVAASDQRLTDPFSLFALGAALIPIMFAFNGWQTASFVAGEVRDPKRNLVRGLFYGVGGVVVLYVAINIAYLKSLGSAGLAATNTPATDLMSAIFGERGAMLAAAGVTISALGFLSQSVLTAPRVIFAMASDGLFFRRVAQTNSRTNAPIAAIIVQTAIAMIVAGIGRYDQILNYAISVEFIFFGLTAICVFTLRRRMIESAEVGDQPEYRIPGHPLTTLFFITASALVVASTFYKYPQNSLIGLAIAGVGIPVYFLWRSSKRS